MIVVLKSDVKEEQIDWITKKLMDRGLELHSISGEERTVLAVVGTQLPDPREVQLFPGTHGLKNPLHPSGEERHHSGSHGARRRL